MTIILDADVIVRAKRAFSNSRAGSAGGGYTTAADPMKFADALMSNKLFKTETLPEAMRRQFTSGDYGFGFQFACIRRRANWCSCCATWTVLRLRASEIGSTPACHSNSSHNRRKGEKGRQETKKEITSGCDLNGLTSRRAGPSRLDCLQWN
jgi:hypothetical protein